MAPPTTSTTAETRALAERYFAAWEGHDWNELRSILADDVTFDGPLANLTDADSCVEGLKGMSKILTGITLHQRLVDGPDVISWFDLETSVADPAPTANWTHVEDGKITAIKVTFDARPLAPPS